MRRADKAEPHPPNARTSSPQFTPSADAAVGLIRPTRLLLLSLIPIVLGYVFGRAAEAKHFRSIGAREQSAVHLPTTSSKAPIADSPIERSEIVHASVVISIDYFKCALATLHTIIGGPVKSHESLLDRARREAVLRKAVLARMKSSTCAWKPAHARTMWPAISVRWSFWHTGRPSISRDHSQMKYQPALPEHNDNVSHEHPLKDLLLILSGLVAVAALAFWLIANRDHLRVMGRGIVLFGISGLLTGSDSGLTGLLTPAAHLGTAKYSHEREALADARALQILNCRYGHAGGATELFEALKKEDPETSSVSHYLASHPSMQARIDAITQAIGRQGMKVGTVDPL